MGSATILSRIGEDQYPIGRFILDRARALSMSRTDLPASGIATSQVAIRRSVRHY
jgi:hypothetical protein